MELIKLLHPLVPIYNRKQCIPSWRVAILLSFEELCRFTGYKLKLHGKLSPSMQNIGCERVHQYYSLITPYMPTNIIRWIKCWNLIVKSKFLLGSTFCEKWRVLLVYKIHSQFNIEDHWLISTVSVEVCELSEPNIIKWQKKCWHDFGCMTMLKELNVKSPTYYRPSICKIFSIF